MTRWKRTSWPSGHVIRMTLDHSTVPSQSVATCECGGFVNRVPWPGFHAEQDAACEVHWLAVEEAAA